MACSCSPARSAHVVTLSPAYPGSGPSWKLIAVGDLGEHVVGDHAQVGDAEQDVGGVLVEPGGRARRPGRRRRCPARWRTSRTIGLVGGDEHDLEAVRRGRCRRTARRAARRRRWRSGRFPPGPTPLRTRPLVPRSFSALAARRPAGWRIRLAPPRPSHIAPGDEASPDKHEVRRAVSPRADVS